MKILFFVPDGLGIRNYLYSDLLPILRSTSNSITLWSVFTEQRMADMNLTSHFDEIRAIPEYREGVVEKLLRESAAYARVIRNAHLSENNSMPMFWTPNKKKTPLLIFYLLALLIAHLFSRHLPFIIQLEKHHLQLVKKNKYASFFNNYLVQEKPDLLFCTHQRAVTAIPAIEMAKMNGIKTITAIYSWDNMPKGRLPIRPDKYLVWSEYMKNEFRLYYPEINEDRIAVVGTPQFDYYEKKNYIDSRIEFCSRYGLNPRTGIICFSGDDVLTSPYDPCYLEDLAKALSVICEEERPQILLRRCPVDFSGRFDEVVKKYKNTIFVANPIWNSSDNEKNAWIQLWPDITDIKLLINVVYHCDVVYNVGSTMALDFAMYDKPGLYINYNHIESKTWDIHKIYNLPHFKSMPDENAVVWINSRDEILSKVLTAIHTPELVATSRKKWLNTIVSLTDMTSAQRIANQLCTLFS